MQWQAAPRFSHVVADGKPPTIHHLVVFLIHPSPSDPNEVQNISHSPASGYGNKQIVLELLTI
jgi:hypothetical protein